MRVDLVVLVVLAASTVSTMPAVTDQMHDDHAAAEQNPDPIFEHPLHFDTPYRRLNTLPIYVLPRRPAPAQSAAL